MRREHSNLTGEGAEAPQTRISVAKLNRRTGTPPTSLGVENEWPVAPIGGVVTGHKKAESSSWLMMAMTDSVV